MKAFIIPSFVKKIGDHIIRQCYSLEKVIFPPVIKIIEFCSNCTNLTEVSISSSVKTIDNRTFYECTSLSTIKIPSSVRSIGNYVFYKCKSLIDVELPKSIYAIGKFTFSLCSSLKSVTIPSSLNSIETGLFEGCSSLEEVIFPPSSQVKSFGEYAFCDCISLKEIQILSSVKNILMKAFNNCSSLETISFKNQSSLITIDFNCFEKCSSLKEIEIPPSVKSIRRFAFKDCAALSNIVIHPSLKIIQPDAFEGCESLDLNLIPSSILHNQIPETDPIIKIKIILIGSSAVGKTCIFDRYIKGFFKESFSPTIGVNYKDKILDLDGNEVKLQIWDTPGLERFHSLIKGYYENAACAIIVFDLCQPESFDKVMDYYNEICEYNGPITVIFMGNKNDVPEHQKEKIKSEKYEEFKNEFKNKYFIVSAKDGYNFDEAFQYAVNQAFYRSIYDDAILKGTDDNTVKNIDIADSNETRNSKC